MDAISLKDLKAENASEDQVPEEANNLESEDAEETEEEEQDLEGSEEGEEAEGSEDWMETGESEEAEPEEQEKAPTFSESDIAKVRRKYKARLSESNEELEKFKQEKAQLEEQLRALQGKSKPVRDSFDSDEDYLKAVIKYERDTEQEAQNAEAAKQAQEKAIRQIEENVEKHYERAMTLAEKNGIKPESYQNADLNVRKAIDKVFPQMGDRVTDGFINALGEGSEKVMFSLGVNKQRLGQLENLLKEDPSGISAAMYLGQLKASANGNKNKQSSAPKPAPRANGENKGNASTSAAKRKYDAAHKKGDASEAFKIKREAKKSGVDTSNW